MVNFALRNEFRESCFWSCYKPGTKKKIKASRSPCGIAPQTFKSLLHEDLDVFLSLALIYQPVDP